MKIRLRQAFLAAAVALCGTASADTIQASSTTMLVGRQDYRNGAVQTAVPIFEIIDVAASDVRTSFADNVEVSLSMWGGLDVGNNVRFWQNGALATDKRLSGDINIGFVRGEFLGRRLSLRLGRQLVADGAARMLHLDGGELRLALPAGFGVSAYAGVPVMPRFEAWGGPFATGNTRANFATGGRVSWRSPGLLDVGASVALARDRGDLSRSELGADFKLTPHRIIAFLGSGWWSLYESRIGEASLAAMVSPVRNLDVTVDYRHVEPDLFLPRNSILAVFAADKRNDIGGNVHWGVSRELALDADYHVLIEDAGTGHWARAKATYHPNGPDTTLGAETSYLYHPFNGYALARLFGAKTIRALTGTLDLYGYFFERSVNGQSQALTATGTVGYGFARGWRAVVAGTAGTTAFLSQQFEVMAKLVYDQTYVAREVR
jgi:hypothetical protein